MSNLKHLDTHESRATQLHCLLFWEKLQPNAIFLTQPIGKGKSISYTWREVADQVRRMAMYLQAQHFPLGSTIAIYGRNSAHWVMADLAIWMAGHVSVPLYPTLNAKTAEYVLEHSDAKLLFIGKLDGKVDSWNQVKDIIPRGMPCIRLPLSPAFGTSPYWLDIIAESIPLQQVTLPEPDALATIMYTSGSTGLPKGVMHSFRTMLQVAQLAEQQFGLTQNDRFLSYLPLAHAAERALLETMSLFNGCQMFFAHDLQSFPQDLRRARPTFFFSVPRLWTKFYQGINERIPPIAQRVFFRLPGINRIVKRRVLKELGLSDVRIAITGSAPLPINIVDWYRRLGLELLEGYAMTENFGYSHVNRPGDNRPGYVGYANPGVECRVTDAGEVLVKSPGTMLGYFKNPEKTAEDITTEGFLRTGDMGELDAQGRLKITGRVKDLFKTAKGKYVAPVPIEQMLGEHTMIESVCVGGGSLPQPVAFVMLAEDVRMAMARGHTSSGLKNTLEAQLSNLQDSVNAKLDAHEKLAFLVIINDPWTIESGLLTPTLKIRRNPIEARYEHWLEGWYSKGSKVVWE